MKKIAFCFGLISMFIFNSCSTENENIPVSEKDLSEISNKIYNDDITKKSIEIFGSLQKIYSEEINSNKLLLGNETALLSEIKKVKSQSELNLVLNEFSVSDNFKQKYSTLNKQLVENFNLINDKYLKNYSLKERAEVFSQINKIDFSKNNSLRPTDCCTAYRSALNACLERAVWDWWVSLSGGIGAIWGSIHAVDRSNKCIFEAENRYENCCR